MDKAGAGTVLYLLLLITRIASPFCVNAPMQCAFCTTAAAECRHNTLPVIPQTLNETTLDMEILYNGDSKGEIASHLFEKYPNLVNVSTSGPRIMFVRGEAYASLRRLVSLRIHRTSVEEIPDNMLPINSSIRQLNLTANKLTRIPYSLFQYLPVLEELHLEDNNIVLPDCKSIGDSFLLLPNLVTLGLAKARMNFSCENISDNFFFPIESTVKSLDLDNSNILRESNPKILSKMTSLEHLDITLADGFSRCPAKASELFNNLPAGLKSLTFQRWRQYTGNIFSKECSLKSKHLQGLKNLTDLKILDMRYSTFIFGHVLKKTVFSGFKALEQLDLAWCQFSLLEEFVFDECPSLKWVSLEGNPIGSVTISAVTSRNNSKISSLQLSRVGIYSDDARSFHFSPFLNNTALETIDLQRNYLDYIPIFVENFDVIYRGVERIYFDSNYLRHLSSSDEETGTNLNAYCKIFPRLYELRASKNRLENITGLCLSLKVLDLANNRLTKFWDTNRAVISQLNNLEILKLSDNEIQSIENELFASMSQLKEIHLEDNYLTTIESIMSENNPLLEVIDLNYNTIREIKLESFAKLKHLRDVYLEYNSISNLDKNLIDYLMSYTQIKIFAIDGNSLQCNCDQYSIQQFIRQTNIVPKAASLTCHGPRDLTGEYIHNYTRNDYLCDHAPRLTISAIVLGSIVGAVLITLLCYRYRWYIRHIKVVLIAIFDRISAVRHECQYLYDGYVMYHPHSEEDLNFVAQQLKPNVEKEEEMENQEELKLYIPERDALPGTPIYTEMISAMERSRKIIIVLSNAYLCNAECRGQADLAGREAYGMKFYQPNKILVLVRERLNEDSIEPPFTSLLVENVIEVYSTSDNAMSRVWCRVRRFLSKPRYEYRRHGNGKAKGHFSQLTDEETSSI